VEFDIHDIEGILATKAFILGTTKNRITGHERNVT
jgi:hypothetical protein